MYRNNALEAYEAVEKTTMSGRETEARVLAKGAQKLKDCQDAWDADNLDERLDAALRFNQRIWSIFQGELVKKDNPLPAKLKADLLSLSAFIDRRIFETMAYPTSDKLTAIININRNIAAGLRGLPT
jgi:flagellar protein FlaF